ncbi:MAG: bifunctional UDP-N-acetylglucosamine diphosphorylase/glucosamine-1-phosphate N-acetyltransferase GlmU, partial [Armatimonadota bacterium]|nr:bifunctional UDP-N-acetylglucosamine diphosphorylase/glucosamine-1-phosphate N-acetyltransferase GlmU [Armatimonadota bacterium]
MSVAAVVLAAGLGKRMRSARPKVVHPVGGRPMLLYVLDAVRAVATRSPIVVVGHGAEAVRAVLPADVQVAVQGEPRGTADAVRAAMPLLEGFQGAVVVAFGDTPLVSAQTFRALVAAHLDQGNAATLVTARLHDPHGYGRIVRDGAGAFVRIVEEPDCDERERAIQEINTGIACFRADMLHNALARVRPDNAQGEYYLTDVFRLLQQAGARIGTVSATEVTEIMGINSRRDLASAEAAMRRRTLQRLMDEGVTVVDPDTTFVDAAARIEPDTVLHPFTVIEGETTIGRGCAIGPGAHLVGARVADGVQIRWSVVEHSEIGEGSYVGPYAHLRPGTRLGRRVEVGNFAEIKNSQVGDGTRIHHVSYLGDATVGREVNIGAGTITCNLRYGVRGKQPTVIEDGAFIGSDTMLQAPVRIGAGAVTGAGSVV